ncbi:MAG: hypothetical protein U1F54_19625 [Burkholderiales bacterium]
MNPNIAGRPAMLAALLASLPCVPALAAPPPDSMLAQVSIPITQARADTGSRIRRALPTITIAAGEPYDKLTPEQRAAFRALFKDLPAENEPPYPVDGLLPIAQSIAFTLADGKVVAGDLFLTVKVDEKGEPQSTAVYATPSDRASKEAASALMRVKYRPGTCAGKPCTAEFPFNAKFE